MQESLPVLIGPEKQWNIRVAIVNSLVSSLSPVSLSIVRRNEKWQVPYKTLLDAAARFEKLASKTIRYVFFYVNATVKKYGIVLEQNDARSDSCVDRLLHRNGSDTEKDFSSQTLTLQKTSYNS